MDIQREVYGKKDLSPNQVPADNKAASRQVVQEATEMNVVTAVSDQVVVTIVVEKEVETVTEPKVLAVHAETQERRQR